MTPWAIPPAIAVAVAFEIFCVFKVFSVPAVQRLPRWLWAVLCVCCNPIGGIAFLALGWEHGRPRGADRSDAC